jgi:hypothetical protein
VSCCTAVNCLAVRVCDTVYLIALMKHQQLCSTPLCCCCWHAHCQQPRSKKVTPSKVSIAPETRSFNAAVGERDAHCQQPIQGNKLMCDTT